MLWVVLVLLLALWVRGMVTSQTLGGWIHGLPVAAVALLILRLASGVIQSSLEAGDKVEANSGGTAVAKIKS